MIDNNTPIKELTVAQFRSLIADAYPKEENVSARNRTIEDVRTTLRYSITEASKILGITVKTLRAHTNEGKIKCSYSKANNRRSYLGSELIRYYRSIW